MIVNEGIPTWLSGARFEESFDLGLKNTSRTFKKLDLISLDDIMSFKIRNEFDNSILYVTGGVICKFVFDKRGKDGIKILYNCNKENFKFTLENLLEKDYLTIENDIISYIKNYN